MKLARIAFLFAFLTGMTALGLGTVPGLSTPVALADSGSGKAPLPRGFDGFFVLMATGLIPPGSTGMGDGDCYQKGVLGRNDTEIAQVRAEALQFFNHRFGIADADTNPDVSFTYVYVDVSVEYRVHAIGGERVPAIGFPNHDGSWTVIVTNPAGITLGGEFAGVHAPAGTAMAFGNYAFQRVQPDKPMCATGIYPAPNDPRRRHMIRMHYESRNPIFIGFDASRHFSCDIFSDDLGQGLAQGLDSPIVALDGSTQLNIRNVITYSENSRLPGL